MGEAKQRQSATKRFLEKHPFCCLCGGSVPADTIEHAPPKVLFINKQLPARSHRVPACKRCNQGSGHQDLVAALHVFNMAAVLRHDIPQSYLRKLERGVEKFSPKAHKALTNRERPLESVWWEWQGLTRLVQRGPVNPALYRDWLNPWAVKQTYALHYLHTGAILPSTAKVLVAAWFTNVDISEQRYPDALLRYLANFEQLRQGTRTSGREFSYRWGSDGEIFGYVLALQDACMVATCVIDDTLAAEARARSGNKQGILFTTNAERGIQAVQE